MPLNKKCLQNCKLYLILDREVNDYKRLFEIAQQSIRCGVDIIQLRDKKGSSKNILDFSKRLSRLTKNKIPFILNDRVDLALLTQASGVHLGQDDIPLKLARKMMGSKAIIGVSCQSLAQAKVAQREGADYIGFGSVFKTLTKPQRLPMDLSLLKRVVGEIKIPIFAIGGIHLENVGHLRAIGLNRIAVCRAICEADNVSRAVKNFKNNRGVQC